MNRILFIVTLFIISLSISPSYATQYEIIGLGTLGGQSSSANAINDMGQVVGDSENGVGKFRPFYWDSNVGMIDIDPSPFAMGSANDINNSGQVVTNNNYLWEINTGAQYLSNMSLLNTINDIGQIAGYGDGGCCGYHAYLWENGGVQDLGTLYLGLNSDARAINNSGEVVGVSEMNNALGGNISSHAFIWDSTNGMQDLGTLGGVSSEAYDINNFGQVVGRSITEEDTYSRAFIWESGIGMQDIGHLGGVTASAKGINNSGRIVGYSASLEYDQDAFIWDSASGMINLNDFIPSSSGWHLRVANDINENGQIVGFGEYNGDTRAFLLTPTVVPEPVSSLLFISGGFIFVSKYIRRKRVS